jgi:hypothetical protein
VYAITSEGTVELRLLAEQAIRSTQPPPDPIGVALSFAATGTDQEELTSWLRSRREIFALHVAELEAERQRLVSRGHLGPLQAAVMYRGQLHAETEVRWHDELAKTLAELPASALPTGEPPANELPGGPPGSGPPASKPPGGPATPADAATRDST